MSTQALILIILATIYFLVSAGAFSSMRIRDEDLFASILMAAFWIPLLSSMVFTLLIDELENRPTQMYIPKGSRYEPSKKESTKKES